MRRLAWTVFPVVLVLATACPGEGRDDDPDAGPPMDAVADAVVDAGYQPDSEAPPAVETDWCDEDPLDSVDFVGHLDGAFRVFYLPGTTAEADLASIVSVRQDALAAITTALALTESRTIEIDIAPSRLAAVAHNIGAGVTFPSWPAIQILYLDDPQSYERQRYGHELTHAIAYNIDANHEYQLKLLQEGLSERLDQSGRDQHQVFVQESRAWGLDVSQLLPFDDWDVNGWSYAKAGSFVQRLFELDPDVEVFKALWRDAWITWVGNTPHASDGAVLDAAKLAEVVDTLLQTHYGLTLADFQTQWLAALTPWQQTEPLRPSAADMAELGYLLMVRDWALSQGDAEAYRSTMEGFACDWTTDAERLATAELMVADLEPTSSNLVEAFDMGLKNYRTAVVVFDKQTLNGTDTLRAEVERFPLGWRFTWVEDEP